jgi:hypothetical protein
VVVITGLKEIGLLFVTGLERAQPIVSIDIVTNSLGIDPNQFQTSGSNIPALHSIHNKLVNSIDYYYSIAGLESNCLIPTCQVIPLLDQAGTRSPPNPFNSTILPINLNGSLDQSLSVYQAIDRSLVSEDRLILFDRLPQSVILQLNQEPNSPATEVILQQTIHLDRYQTRNKPSILQTRHQLFANQRQTQLVRDQQTKLTTTKSDLAPSSLVKSAINLLDHHQQELTNVLNSIESDQAQLSAELDKLATANQTAFDHLATNSRYSLSSVMIRNGLNGRTSWKSIVVGDEGDYYSVSESGVEQVELSSALADKTGLLLGAGVGFAFYQQDEVSRLRGGATEHKGEQEEDEDESGEDSMDELSDEDYEQEDEVELGRLVKGDEFDVDLGVGKVGGKPVWLDPSNPLDYNKVLCSECGLVMSFLLQLNSPDDSRPHANARTLYLFACSSKHQNPITKLFRTQSHSPNQFFPHTSQAKDSRRHFERALDPATALGGHHPPDQPSPFVFEEYLIECEEEPYEESYLPEIDHNPVKDHIQGDDQKTKDTKVAVDRTFLQFQQR